MTSDSDYQVVVTREGADWLADVPSVPGAHTDAHNLVTLDRYVREVIVLAAELPDEAVPTLPLRWEYHTGDPLLDEHLAQLRHSREELEHYRHQLEAETAKYVHQLDDAGFSVRDAGALVGVSHQRAQQLLAGEH